MSNLHEQALSALQRVLKGRTGALLRTLETVFEERSLHAALQARRQLAELRAIARFLQHSALQRLCAELQNSLLQMSSQLPQGMPEAQSRPCFRLGLQITWHFGDVPALLARVQSEPLRAPDLPAVLLKRVRQLLGQCNELDDSSGFDAPGPHWQALRAAAEMADALPESVRATHSVLQALLRWEQQLLPSQHRPVPVLLNVLASRLRALLDEASATAAMRRTLEKQFGALHSRMRLLLQQSLLLLCAFPLASSPLSCSLKRCLHLALRLEHGMQRWQSIEALAASSVCLAWRHLLLRVQLRLQDDLALAASDAAHPCAGLTPESLARAMRRTSLRQRFEVPRTILRGSLGDTAARDGVLVAELQSVAASEQASCVACLRAWRAACAEHSGPHFVPDNAFLAVCRLAQLALVAGESGLYELLATLQRCVTLTRELQRDACPVLQSLDDVLGCVCSASEWRQRDRVVRQLLTLESRLAVIASATDADLPLSLARNVRALPAFRVRQFLEEAPIEVLVARNRQLLLELRMLASGARALRVYRIASLSAALAQVHEVIAAVTESPAQFLRSSAAEALLERTHAALCRGLNQAAARQEVSECRALLGDLYEWLSWHGEQSGARQDFVRESQCLMAQIEAADSRETRLHALHTLKGNAAMYRCDAIVQLCHRSEQEILEACNEAHASFVREPDAQLLPLLVQLRAAVDEAVDHSADSGRRDGTAVVGSPDRPVDLPVNGLADRATERPYRATEGPQDHLRRLSGRLSLGLQAIAEILQGAEEARHLRQLPLVLELLQEQLACATHLQEDLSASPQVCFMRLVPRLRRVVEDVANRHGKAAGLEIRNASLTMPRAMLERLVAPLEHLLRNALIHGIEAPEQRMAAGKPECGRVVLVLEREEENLCLRLEDDGAGIAPSAVPARLFQTGYSTRDKPDADAGHGIGLAAVKSAVEALGGMVTVSTTPGQGTCFRLQLPDVGELGDIHAMPL